jgi:sortase A
VTITIGTVNPGEVVTVRIIIRVNSTAPTTAQPCNVARITYSTSGSRQSNTQCFRVRGGSSLPPTGELAIEPAESGLPWASLAFLVTLGLGGMILLRVALAVWKSQPRQARWLLGSGVLVTGLALFSGLAAMGTFNRETTPNPQIGMTSEALTVLTATPSVTTNPLARLPAYMFATPDPDEPSVIETLPSFPIPTPSITITPGVEDSGPDTSAAVRMVIPRMDLDARVAYVPFNGQTWLIQGLREEIAWLGNTSWPGLGGNTGFAAHVTVRGLGNGPFRFLNELSPGDEIRVYTERQIYTYRVRELRIVEETDLWVTDPSENPQITLITCVDWNENIGIYLKRLIVIADQVGLAPLASR